MIIIRIMPLKTLSFQMCHQAEDLNDTSNAIAFIIIVSFAKTMAYSTVSVFLFLFFPIEKYALLYGLANMPTLVTFWLSDPLFSIILGEEEDGSQVILKNCADIWKS